MNQKSESASELRERLEKIIDLTEKSNTDVVFPEYRDSANRKIIEESWILLRKLTHWVLSQEVGKSLLQYNRSIEDEYLRCRDEIFGEDSNSFAVRNDTLLEIVGNTFLTDFEYLNIPEMNLYASGRHSDQRYYQFADLFSKRLASLKIEFKLDRLLLPVISTITSQTRRGTPDWSVLIEFIHQDANSLLAGGQPTVFQRRKGGWRDPHAEKLAKAYIVQHFEFLKGQEFYRRGLRDLASEADDLTKLLMSGIHESFRPQSGEKNISYEALRTSFAEAIGISEQSLKKWRAALQKEAEFAFYIEASWMAGYYSESFERELQAGHYEYQLPFANVSVETLTSYKLNGYPPRTSEDQKTEEERLHDYLGWLSFNDFDGDESDIELNETRWHGYTTQSIAPYLWSRYRSQTPDDLRDLLNRSRKNSGKK